MVLTNTVWFVQSDNFSTLFEPLESKNKARALSSPFHPKSLLQVILVRTKSYRYFCFDTLLCNIKIEIKKDINITDPSSSSLYSF